jgi:hypothetical protein
MNIYQRINEVRKAVAYVKKDKKVDGGGYMAVTHDAVTALAREHLITHGVVIVPSLVASSVQQTGTTTAKGVPFIRYEARYMFNVVNADDPQDKFALEIESHAIDQGDKAPGKALSYAKKYAVLKLLEIESGEEEEEREHQKAKVTPNAGAGESLTNAQKEKVNRIAGEIIDWFKSNNEEKAFEVYEESALDVEEKLFLWSFLGSKQRSAIKKMGEAKKGNGTKH